MIEDITALSYSLFHNKGVFALFLGSGISRPAGIMTGWEIIVDQIQQLAALSGEEITGSPEAWYRAKFNKEPDYSDILDALTKSSGERVNALKKYFEPTEEEQENNLKLPTIAHQQIAKLVKGGFVKVIITTNFDRLIENALKAEQIETVVISNADQVENVQPLFHNAITIIKINGDYLDTKFLNIKTELSAYDQRLKSLLNIVFENFGLITCGWSAAWDIAIVEQLKASNKFRYGNYFTYRGQPAKELEDLSNYRKGVLLPIQSADSFFTTLAEDMEAMQHLHIRHPLTKELAVAKLKKYIVRNEGRIQLHDMLFAEAEDLYQAINERVFPTSTWPAVKEEIAFSKTQSAILASLLVNGVYWGDHNHHDLWIKILSKFLYTNELPVRNGIWWKYRNYPPLYLFYAMGISAVLAKDFEFLAKLLRLKIFSKDERKEVYVIGFINNFNVFEKKEMNTILGNNDDQPMSRHLLAELKPHYKRLIVNDRDYEDAFDYFEYALTLVYHTLIEHDHGIWMPLGFFAQKLKDSYHRKFSIVTRKQEESQLLKDKFELANNSLFKNYAEYQTADQKFMDWIKDMHFL